MSILNEHIMTSIMSSIMSILLVYYQYIISILSAYFSILSVYYQYIISILLLAGRVDTSTLCMTWTAPTSSPRGSSRRCLGKIQI